MRLLSTLLLVAGVAAGDVTRLRELADARQLFQLREALQEPGWNTAETLFYRSMVDSRFGEERKGIDGLTRFVAREPSPAQRRRAFEELAAAFAREGRYGEAARTVAEALRLTPTDEQADNANKRALYAALADIPRQRVTFGRDVPVRAVVNQLGSWDVPVDVNGHRGLWIFDSGANWSTLSAGEADRLGLDIRDSEAYVGGATGQRNALRLAVASDLRLGRAHLKHVVFLILSDESLFVGPLKYQIRGILGLPVIRALERVRLTASGDLRIERGRTSRESPNLFFDGMTPIVEVRHGDRRLQMFLDTGANASYLHRSFRAALIPDEIASLTTREETTAGAGGIVVRRTEVVPTLRLLASGRPMDLSDVSLLTTAAEGDARHRDGVLGTDAVRAGFTLDFRAMQFRPE